MNLSEKLIEVHEALHNIQAVRGIQGVGNAKCLEIPPLVSGSTGIGPSEDYYSEENAKEMKELLSSGVTISQCLEYVISKMRLVDSTPNSYYVTRCIPEWLRYLAWLLENGGPL